MLQNYFSIRQSRLTQWSFLVHSTTRNASYTHPSHGSILEFGGLSRMTCTATQRDKMLAFWPIAAKLLDRPHG